MGAHLTVEQKQLARRLRAKGLAFKVIARELSCEISTIRVTVRDRQVRPGRPGRWSPGPGRLRIEEREDIMVGLSRGQRGEGFEPSTFGL